MEIKNNFTTQTKTNLSMKRIIHFLFVFLLCSISKVSLAQQIDINTAKTVAKNHLESIAGPALKSTIGPQNTINFTSVIPEIVENETLYYIRITSYNVCYTKLLRSRMIFPMFSALASFHAATISSAPESGFSTGCSSKKRTELVFIFHF